MAAGRIAKPVACEECHPVPADWNDESHPDLVTDVWFGRLAETSGATPSWDVKEARCANTYCHGSTLSDASRRPSPVWTQVDGSQLVCSACHGNPPGDSSHEAHAFILCNGCHATVIDTSGVLTELDLHVDGEMEISMPTGGTWDAGQKTCAGTGSGCHGSGSIGW
jgi:predicted CxxxxCH...CXXCH cytochrome family protein